MNMTIKNLIKCHLRTGQSFNFVQKMFILRTEKNIDKDQLRKNIQKILFLLVGMDDDVNQRKYHASFQDRLNSRPNVGQFFKDYTELNDDLYDFLKQQGSSALSKALSMPLDELENLITRCENLPPDDVKKLVETHETSDLECIVDGTYMKGFTYLINERFL